MKRSYFTSTSRYHWWMVVLLFFSLNAKAQQPQNTEVDLNKTPKRIIRACCVFGYDYKFWGIPFLTLDQVIDVTELGQHQYMGGKKEVVGTLYTHKGGFIDVGHMRDQIDWTRYLYELILFNRGKGEFVMPLRNEGGSKKLYLRIPEDFSEEDARLLAGKITYDFSLWHEISTWYGASAVPGLSEKFSSFSIEDVYSNLLGIHIGMKSLKSSKSFNEAVTEQILIAMDSLGVAKSKEESYQAYDKVLHKWYTTKKRLPSTETMKKRDPDVLTYSKPWVLPDSIDPNDPPITLKVPLLDSKGQSLTNYYEFTIDLNYRFPVEEIFPDRTDSLINQNDYAFLLDHISKELRVLEKGVLAE